MCHRQIGNVITRTFCNLSVNQSINQSISQSIVIDYVDLLLIPCSCNRDWAFFPFYKEEIEKRTLDTFF